MASNVAAPSINNSTWLCFVNGRAASCSKTFRSSTGCSKPRRELLAILRQFFGDMFEVQFPFAADAEVALKLFAAEHPIQRHGDHGKQH